MKASAGSVEAYIEAMLPVNTIAEYLSCISVACWHILVFLHIQRIINKAATVNFKIKLSFSCLTSHQHTPDVTFSLLNNTNVLFWMCNLNLMFSS